jgi:hypothetical protein
MSLKRTLPFSSSIQIEWTLSSVMRVCAQAIAPGSLEQIIERGSDFSYCRHTTLFFISLPQLCAPPAVLCNEFDAGVLEHASTYRQVQDCLSRRAALVGQRHSTPQALDFTFPCPPARTV